MENRKQILSWCLYDFANSSYSSVIAAVIFPVYFVKGIAPDPLVGDLWWGRAISLSMAFVAVTSPFVGGLADNAGKRKAMLFFYTLLCVISVGLLAFVERGMILETVLLVVLANVGMEGALVFYNSYLPELVPYQFRGRISGWGFGLGYAGSILALLFALFLMKAGRATLIWPMVSLFFFLFSLPAFLSLSGGGGGCSPKIALLKGLRETCSAVREILARRDPRMFLLSYFFYKDGVNTIIIFSSIYASVTLSFSMQELVFLYLLVQFTAMAGSFLLAGMTDRLGPRQMIRGLLVFWIVVTAAAYFIHDKGLFWGIAIAAGGGLGVIQAASRAFYSRFITEGEEGKYFGVYALTGKTSAILGPILFGSISSVTGSQRYAVLSIVLFFIIGLSLFSGIRER